MLLAEGIYVKLLSNNICDVPYLNIIRSHKTARNTVGEYRRSPRKRRGRGRGVRWVSQTKSSAFPSSLFPVSSIARFAGLCSSSSTEAL